jgi:hypothetical protein
MSAATIMLELDTFSIVDGRDRLAGCVHAADENPLPSGVCIMLSPVAGDRGTTATAAPPTYELDIPIGDLTPGYYRLSAATNTGKSLAICGIDGVREPPAVVIGCPPSIGLGQRRVRTRLQDFDGTSARASSRKLHAFLASTLETMLAQSSATAPPRLQCITTCDQSRRSYRSIGASVNGKRETYWFPESVLTIEPTRLDLVLVPALDRAASVLADERWRAHADNAIAVFCEHGFHPCSGLGYLAVEADLNVRSLQPLPRMGGKMPRFKPTDLCRWPESLFDRLWSAAPAAMARMGRGAYYALVTAPETMDYNRHCLAAHCAFASAGASLIRLWISCWLHDGDGWYRDLAQRMADKWLAVQDPDSGLVPYCFGAEPEAPLPMPPKDFAEPMDGAVTARGWAASASALLANRDDDPLGLQLREMSCRLAGGIARYSFDAGRRVFHHFLRPDGAPYTATARYTFPTAATKAAAVAEAPEMVQVPVFSGFGIFTPGPYWRQVAGTTIPADVAVAAALTDNTELAAALGPWVDEIERAAASVEGAFTEERLWTFAATGHCIDALLAVAPLRSDGKRLHALARAVAEREVAALSDVTFPHWWRLAARTEFIDALLSLYETTLEPEDVC